MAVETAASKGLEFNCARYELALFFFRREVLHHTAKAVLVSGIGIEFSFFIPLINRVVSFLLKGLGKAKNRRLVSACSQAPITFSFGLTANSADTLIPKVGWRVAGRWG